MKADRDFFRRDPKDPWAQEQARARQIRLLAGLLTFFYGMGVMYTLETTSFVPPPAGGYILGALFLLVFFIVYWLGRIFCRHWWWAQISTILFIAAGTFLPFIV